MKCCAVVEVLSKESFGMVSLNGSLEILSVESVSLIAYCTFDTIIFVRLFFIFGGYKFVLMC